MKSIFTKITATIIFASLTGITYAQDDMMDMLEEASPVKKEYTTATFKDTRIINLQSSETVGKRTLQYRIQHRFGDINTGANQLFGLDGGASMKMGLEYSYDGRFSVGFYRTNIEKQLEGFAKYRLLRQTTDNKMPISLTLFSGTYITTLKDDPANPRYFYYTSRMSYVHQIIIARKFGERISLQMAPTMVHYNLVDKANESNDTYALAFGGRIKLTRRNAITFEYVARLNKFTPNATYYDHAGIGFDIETGGHVFQFMFVNSFGMNETQFIPKNDKAWQKSEFRLGFNISRVFTL